MVNQQMINYIRTQLAQGATKTSIFSTMVAGGWTSDDIEIAFAEASKEFKPMGSSQSFERIAVKEHRNIAWKIVKVIFLIVIIVLCILFYIGG